ncbi:hypothetical protein CRT22_24760 [Escherichia sp. E5028]|nr:hypothetical protein CRT22_24760 [Escherichia sp. E5028]
MNGTIYQRIEDNAHFRELVEKRQRFATILSIIMLAVYISFILLIAFAPGWLGTPLNPNTSVTRGIPWRVMERKSASSMHCQINS